MMLQLSLTKESHPAIQGIRRLKQGRILGTEVILALPSCFINGMVRPLHLAELYRLIASLSFCDINNSHGVLLIGYIFLEVDELVIHGPIVIFESLLELRDMKDIKHLDFFRKLKCISHLSS